MAIPGDDATRWRWAPWVAAGLLAAVLAGGFLLSPRARGDAMRIPSPGGAGEPGAGPGLIRRVPRSAFKKGDIRPGAVVEAAVGKEKIVGTVVSIGTDEVGLLVPDGGAAGAPLGPGESVRTIPLSALSGAAEVKPGVWIEAFIGGRRFVGLVLSVGKDALTARMHPEERPAQASGRGPARLSRRIPYAVFSSTAGLKVGARISAQAGGKEFFGVVTALGKDDLTVEIEPP